MITSVSTIEAQFPGRLRRRCWLVFLDATDYKSTPVGVVEHVRLAAVHHLSVPGEYRDLEIAKRLIDLCRLQPEAAHELAAQALATARRASR
jgi:hypothetical protein